MSLAGKTIVMTGATDGLGKPAALKLAADGAKLTIIARNEEKAREIVKLAGDRARFVKADLASLEDVGRAAEEIAATHSNIDLLINNAGVVKSRLEHSPDGFEMSVAVNHLAVAALTLPLVPRLLAAPEGARIIITNSRMHTIAPDDAAGAARFEAWRKPPRFGTLSAYGRAKLANLQWTYALARRLEGTNVKVNALHPGVVGTQLTRDYGSIITFAWRLISISPEKGAEPLVHLAAAPELASVTGAYFDRHTRARSSARSYDRAEQEAVWAETARVLGRDAGERFARATES